MVKILQDAGNASQARQDDLDYVQLINYKRMLRRLETPPSETFESKGKVQHDKA